MKNKKIHDYPTALITFQQAIVKYESFVALDIPALAFSGNRICLVGHNGSGKSTMIKALLRLLPLSSGMLDTQIISAGEKFAITPSLHMAFSPEQGSVFSDISVEEYIQTWCYIKHRNAKYYRQAGAKYIEALNIAPLLNKLGRDLSKGQRRRVQTAVGFIADPLFFLFDEPFDGLDVKQASDFAEIVREESRNRAFLLSSHRMGIVERLADTIIVLSNGKVAAIGSLEDVVYSLASQCFHISLPAELLPKANEICGYLQKEFNTSIVHNIGALISITGNGLCPETLIASLEKVNVCANDIFPVQPSLEDAIDFFLRLNPKITSPNEPTKE
ncbi:MAG: ATP-binding cassette domain-containing protein [bacterium]|nr:ATP-binding cassette domain-containing protein [bacterium]